MKNKAGLKFEENIGMHYLQFWRREGECIGSLCFLWENISEDFEETLLQGYNDKGGIDLSGCKLNGFPSKGIF